MFKKFFGLLMIILIFSGTGYLISLILSSINLPALYIAAHFTNSEKELFKYALLFNFIPGFALSGYLSSIIQEKWNIKTGLEIDNNGNSDVKGPMPTIIAPIALSIFSVSISIIMIPSSGSKMILVLILIVIAPLFGYYIRLKTRKK